MVIRIYIYIKRSSLVAVWNPNVRTTMCSDFEQVLYTIICTLKSEQICSDFRHFYLFELYLNRTMDTCLKSERVRISDVFCIKKKYFFNCLVFSTLYLGREHLVQLETPGAADQKYNLAFQVVDNLPPSDPVQVAKHLTWGSWNLFRSLVTQISNGLDFRCTFRNTVNVRNRN